MIIQINKKITRRNFSPIKSGLIEYRGSGGEGYRGTCVCVLDYYVLCVCVS